MLCSENTSEGRRVTKLDQILLNGNNIAMLVPGSEYPLCVCVGGWVGVHRRCMYVLCSTVCKILVQQEMYPYLIHRGPEV